MDRGRRNSSDGNASDLVTHHWAAYHCVGGSNPNACERSLASHAIYTLIQCTPLLVEKAGVYAHKLWPSGSQHTSKKECRRDIHSGFETHEEGHTVSPKQEQSVAPQNGPWSKQKKSPWIEHAESLKSFRDRAMWYLSYYYTGSVSTTTTTT